MTAVTFSTDTFNGHHYRGDSTDSQRTPTDKPTKLAGQSADTSTDINGHPFNGHDLPVYIDRRSVQPVSEACACGHRRDEHVDFGGRFCRVSKCRCLALRRPRQEQP